MSTVQAQAEISSPDGEPPRQTAQRRRVLMRGVQELHVGIIDGVPHQKWQALDDLLSAARLSANNPERFQRERQLLEERLDWMLRLVKEAR